MRDLAHKIRNPRPRSSKRGSAIVEVALLMPWIAFLFIGLLDFGFYSYAAISVENAARVAALYATTSGGNDQPTSCFYILQELATLPNSGTFGSTCNAAPLVVTLQATNVYGTTATQVNVTYTSVAMIPLPTLTGKYTITRSAWVEQ